jgi:serine/threonine protein kinase
VKIFWYVALISSTDHVKLDDTGKAKLCDFGFARTFSSTKRPTTMCGTGTGERKILKQR